MMYYTKLCLGVIFNL